MKIYVINPDRMCFWVDADTLEPTSCSFYDAYAYSDPLNVPTISSGEWNSRREAQRNAAR